MYSCKLIVMGNSGVGKTTLVHSFVSNEFSEDFKSTIGADFSSKTVQVDGNEVDLQIWDTAGEERFHSVGAAFYRGTDACILVYDMTQPESFKKIGVWLSDLLMKTGVKNDESFPVAIFGNKSDLKGMKYVTYEEAKRWADERGCSLFEVSAKTQENVEIGFLDIIRRYLKNMDKSIMPNTLAGFKITSDVTKPSPKSDCC